LSAANAWRSPSGAGRRQGAQELARAAQPRDGVHRAPGGVEDQVHAVAGQGAVEHAAVAEVDAHLGHRTHRAPVEHEAAQHPGHGGIGVQRLLEEAAVGAGQLLVEATEEAKGEDGQAAAGGVHPGGVEVGVPAHHHHAERYGRAAARSVKAR
jgi:hypothetical protein